MSSEPATDASEDVIDLYRRHAAAFARARSQAFSERSWIDRFLAVAGSNGAVLDVGCGAGLPIARYVAQARHPVTGVDSSPDLLDQFGRNIAGAKCVLEDMRKLALGQRFAGVLAWDSLFHLTGADQRAMFPILASHAAPGAALMFNSGPASGCAIGTFEGDPLYHASLNADEYRGLLDAQGFSLVAHVESDRDCGGRTVWLFRKRTA